MATDRSMWRWSVDGIGVNPEGHVVRGPSDAEFTRDFGSLETLAAERDQLKTDNLELAAEVNKLKTENEKLKEENGAAIHRGYELSKKYLECAELIRDLRFEIAKLRGDQSPGNASMGPLPVEAIVNNVPNLARALAPLRCGGIHLDVPGGSTVTITLPKD